MYSANRGIVSWHLNLVAIVWASGQTTLSRLFPAQPRPSLANPIGASSTAAARGLRFLVVPCLNTSLTFVDTIVFDKVQAHEYWHIIQGDLARESAAACAYTILRLNSHGTTPHKSSVALASRKSVNKDVISG